jgi:hypothetical protein
MKQLGLFLNLFLFLLIGGCQAEDIFPLPKTPTPFLIGFPANLSDPLVSTILDCADTVPGGSLQTNTYSELYPNPNDFHLLIWQGSPTHYSALDNDGLSSFVVIIEEIVVIVSPENNLTTLSPTDLRSIFSGKIQDWSKFPQSGLSGSIELWVYYADHPLRLIFDNAHFGDLVITTTAVITPSQVETNALIEGIANGISYISKSKVSPNTRIVPISGVLETPNLTTLVIFQDNEEIRISPVLDCLLETNRY